MSQHLYSIYPGAWPLVAESRTLVSVEAEVMDELWATGWRHFGPDFFRASLMADDFVLKRQIALRIDLNEFAMSKSQRRTIRRNSDLETTLEPAAPGEQEHYLFEIHKTRFSRNVPEHLEDFLGDRPHGKPCECLQLSVRDGERLIAASYLAIGSRACSSVYAVFDPEFASRRLGIFTMLAELQYAREEGFHYFYSGYGTLEPSCYDYKKQFSALQYYNWEGSWRAVEGLQG